MIMTPERSRTLNAIALLLVCVVLIAAFYYQFTLYELPCPLCLLQRVGFVAVGFGLALNLLYGARPHHYGIMLIGAIYGVSVSIRQILLHIVPGTGHYGSPVFGLHYYTWAGIVFFLIVLGTAIMLMFPGQFDGQRDGKADRSFGGSFLAKAAFVLIVVVALSNVVSTFLECGPGICDDPPLDYKELDRLEGDT